MRVRLHVRPGDFGDIEFESFTGMLAALEGMNKSLHNTDWLAAPMEEHDLIEALEAIDHLRTIFETHREDQANAGQEFDRAAIAENAVTEVSLTYRPKVLGEH